jgi:hypothetical protein
MIGVESNPRFPPRCRPLTHGSTFPVRLLREPHIVLTTLNPGYYQGQWLVTGSAWEDDDGTNDIWNIAVHAICADLH